MAKKAKIKANKVGKIDQSTNIEDSEIQSEALDVNTDLYLETDTLEELDQSTSIKGSKIQKGWLIVVLAIIAGAITILTVYLKSN